MSNKKDTYKHGFNAPEGYLENFEDRLFADKAVFEFPESDGFKIPDGYFEALDARLIAASKAPEAQPKVIQLYRNKYVRYVAAIAACTILMVTIVNGNDPTSGTIEDIELAAISEYIETENVDFDTFDVIALLQEEELTNLNTQNQYVSEETLETYLLETLEDATLLTE